MVFEPTGSAYESSRSLELRSSVEQFFLLLMITFGKRGLRRKYQQTDLYELGTWR